MIERLELRRWRAFDHVAVDFEPGTTFLIAPNGVGKTSLLLGLTWALFGEHSNVEARTCVRIGHDDAEATVTLVLADDQRLVIHRSITTAGKTNVDYSDGNQRIDDARANQLLVAEFGAPIQIAARLAVIRGSGRDDGELQLQEHLYDAFGVSGLRQAAASASKLHKEAVAARKKLRSASRSHLADRDQLAAEAEELRQRLEDLAERRVPLTAAVTDAVRAHQARAEWEAHDVKVNERSHALAQLLEQAAGQGIVAATLDELTDAIAMSVAANQSNAENERTQQTHAQAQAFAARTALDLLESHEPSCPTCARPFHGDELERAVAAQHDSLSLAQARIEETRAALGRLAEEQVRLTELQDRATELGRPIPEPDEPRPTGDIEAALATAQASLRQHDELVGSVTSEGNAITAQLENDDELQAAYAAELVAWRREALTQAAAAALAGTAERLAKEYIEPLSQQVRWRWKILFGEDGLQLRPDGTIVRAVGDRELPWNQLSSGEQIWARLVASLLVLRSSTGLSFAWLDEPLEHLDPRSRRIVATDLATATDSGRPAQLIVTTYEHTLARQLAEDLPDAHLRQINRTEAFELPPRRRADRPEKGGDSSTANGETSPAA